MKAEVVASHKKIKLAAVAGVMGLGGLALCGGSVSAMSSHDSMVINPVYQKYMQDVSAGNGASWKLIPNKYIYNGEYGGKGSDLVLPSSYKIEDKYLTTLKNQGTDWELLGVRDNYSNRIKPKKERRNRRRTFPKTIGLCGI